MSETQNLRRLTEKLIKDSKNGFVEDEWLNHQFQMLDIRKKEEADQKLNLANSESKTELFHKKMAFFDLERNTAFSGNKYGLFDNLMEDFNNNSAKLHAENNPGPDERAMGEKALKDDEKMIEALAKNTSGLDYSFGLEKDDLKKPHANTGAIVEENSGAKSEEFLLDSDWDILKKP